MPINWYSVEVSLGTNMNDPATNTFIVKYYFSVDNTNLITGFYNYNNIGINILAPSVLPSPFGGGNVPGDNFFNQIMLLFSYSGVNFVDDILTAYLTLNGFPVGKYQYFNFYNGGTAANHFWVYICNNTNQDIGTEVNKNYIKINRLSGPPAPVLPPQKNRIKFFYAQCLYK